MNVPTGSVTRRVLQLALESDTKSARCILMMASFVWAVLLFLPGDGFYRPIYAPMKAIASDDVWGLLFSVHFFATFYSSFFQIRNRLLMCLEGILGVSLYSISTLSVMANNGPPGPLFANSIACALAALWVLVRYPELK